MEPNDTTMLSMNDVAERLGVSLSFAHKLVRTGELESYRFGRCRRVSEAQLQSYLERSVADEQPGNLTTRRLRHFG